jgi:hypothetical protein
MTSKLKKFKMCVWIDVASPSLDDTHELRNFGEDLWRKLRDEPRASINLDEVDAATEKLVVYFHTASKSNLRWLDRLITVRLKRYKRFDGRVTLRSETMRTE